MCRWISADTGPKKSNVVVTETSKACNACKIECNLVINSDEAPSCSAIVRVASSSIIASYRKYTRIGLKFLLEVYAIEVEILILQEALVQVMIPGLYAICRI